MRGLWRKGAGFGEAQRKRLCGIAVGIAGIGGGYAIGISGDTGDRMAAQNPKGFVAMILVMVFAGVPQLYGLIVALTMQQAGSADQIFNCEA